MKKIFFAKLFIVSILIMVLNNIVNLFNNAPELFKYGDILFHFFQNILSIITQLSSSMAAAIIFYYCVEFLNKSKDLDKYRDFRTRLYFIFYSYLESTKNAKGFEKFKDRQTKPGDMFNYKDVPIFIDLIESFDRNTLINNISNYLFSLEYKDIDKIIRSLNISIEKLKEFKDYRYVKESTERVDNILTLYEYDLSISEGFCDTIIEHSINKKEDIKNFLDDLVEYYICVLEDIIFLYENTNKFIDSIEKRNIWTFITLLD